jgi:hypothetical protein
MKTDTILKNSDYLLKAKEFAKTCASIIEDEGLSSAINYCAEQRVDPPQCSLTAKSDNADKMRLLAANMLSDPTWWGRRLKRLENQDFESLQREHGMVTNIVSDATLEYYLKSKK